MTKDQVRAVMLRDLPEYFDGFVLIGRVAGRSEIVVATASNSPNTTAALAIGLTMVASDPIWASLTTAK